MAGKIESKLRSSRTSLIFSLSQIPINSLSASLTHTLSLTNLVHNSAASKGGEGECGERIYRCAVWGGCGDAWEGDGGSVDGGPTHLQGLRWWWWWNLARAMCLRIYFVLSDKTNISRYCGLQAFYDPLLSAECSTQSACGDVWKYR
jgi:hypothetical protein